MNTHFKSIALSIALGLSTSDAMAHSNSCNVDMKYDINLNGGSISLSENQQEYVRISNDDLYIKGQKQNLNSKQQRLLSAYAQEVRELIPVVNDVAIEASSLALEAVTDVSTSLLSQSPDAAQKIQERVQNLSDELRSYVSNKHLYSQRLDTYIEDTAFEEEIESLVREVVADVVQGDLGNMIAAAIRGDESEIQAFEAKMEQFGRDMEEKYERKAEEIEAKADKLCDIVEKMDEKEDLFIEEFSKYKAYQLVRVSD